MTITNAELNTTNYRLSIQKLVKDNFATIYGFSVNYDDEEFDPDDLANNGATVIEKWVSMWFLSFGGGIRFPTMVQFDCWTRVKNDPLKIEAEAMGFALRKALKVINFPLYDYAVPGSPVLTANTIIIQNDNGDIGFPDSIEPISEQMGNEKLHGVSYVYSFISAKDLLKQQ